MLQRTWSSVLILLVFMSGWGFAQPAADPATAEIPEQESRAVLEGEGVTWQALGNSVVMIDSVSGETVWRKAVSGPVSLLEHAGSGVSVVTSLPDGLSQRISLDEAGRASGQIRFTTDAEILDSLRQEALAADDPRARLETDSTNPWLYALAAGAAAEDEAGELYASAIATASTFYDLAGLAALLVEAGEHELAGTAMQASLQDFARRGYDAALLTDRDIHMAYGFPLVHLEPAIAAGDAEAAGFWAYWLEAFAEPGLDHVEAGLAGYAAFLDDQGEPVAAAQWRERATQPAEELAATGVERLFTSLGRSGWYMFASIVVVILALQITLTLKYWEPQGLAMRRAQETGGKAGFQQRFLAIRFFSTTEKLVLALLYAAGIGILGLTAWSDPLHLPSQVLGSGTMASAAAHDTLDTLDLRGERGQFIRGYAAQVAGDSISAELHYRAASRYGPAVNNLAVLTGADELFEDARRLAPALGRIDWNLGDSDSQPLFDQRAGLERPVLVVPTVHDFQSGLRGTWQQALSSYFVQPFAAFSLEARWLPGEWLWYVLLGLYLLLGVLTLLWILVPRPRMARNAPRSAGYQLLAVLVPGSGMADEVWGILLLVPWGLFGVDLFWRLAFGTALLDVTMTTVLVVLAVLYAVNLIAFIVEYISYRRRINQLFELRPEAGIAYGHRIEA